MTIPPHFYRQLAELTTGYFQSIHDRMTGVCESPIETLFAAAFAVLGTQNYGLVALVNPDDVLQGHEGRAKRLTWFIAPQRKVGDYRVDFIVGDYADIEVQLIVECDGHDFHEKTKEQAARDKRRDRELQSAGHRVFHYTGREIYADALGCAAEVFEELIRLQDIRDQAVR